MFKNLLLATALVSFAGISAAHAQLVTNGSFENNVLSDNGLTTGSNGYYNVASVNTTSIDGWTVGGAQGVDLIDTYWQAQQGTWSIDLNGYGQGSLSQTLATQVGHSYEITFELASNPGINPAVLEVSAAGYNGIYTFNDSGANAPQYEPGYIDGKLAWTAETFFFIADSTSTTLTFDSLVGGASGPALDNIAGADIPEPASAAVLLAGLGALGLGLRRRAR